jgi:outer membrane protein assembly factor BamA
VTTATRKHARRNRLLEKSSDRVAGEIWSSSCLLAVSVPATPRSRIVAVLGMMPGALLLALVLFQGGCASIPDRRQAVDAVAFYGTSEVDDDDILEKLATAPSPKFLGLFRGLVYDYEIFDRLTLQRDLARVERYYRARGFYDAHARAGRVIARKGNHVRIEIVVEEGLPVRVRRVRIEGASELPPALRDTLDGAARKPLPSGKPFEEENLAASVAQVERTLTDNGYARAKVVRDVTVDVVQHAADVFLTVDPGPKAVFGKVTIEGLGRIPEAPVRRALDIQEGEPYSTSALDSARQAILDLGVFSSAQLVPTLSDKAAAPEQARAGGTGTAEEKIREAPIVVPLVVRVEPTKLRTVRLGVGAEFDAIKTDVHALVGYENDNLFGGLRRYTITFKPGVVLYPLRMDNWVTPERLLPEFQLKNDFRQPGFIEARTNGLIRPEVNLFPVLLQTRTLPTDSILGYLEFRTSVGVDRTTWKLYTALTHNVQVEKPFSYRGSGDPALQTLLLSYPELITNLDFSDSRVRPHKGVWLGNSIQVAGGPFGGDAKDVRVRPDARAYVPLGKRVTFAVRGSLGFLFPENYGAALQDDLARQSTDSVSRIRDLQVIFFRGFFAGGANSNRGYPLRGIGPYQVVTSPAFGGSASLSACSVSAATEEECRIPVGGTTLWESSAEFRFSVLGPFSMATFCDAADVSAKTVDVRFSHPHLSCGVGGRYDTPVGPIRLDIGYRIPGVQVFPRPDPTEKQPDPLFGILPVALAFGIGEAY